MIREGLAKILKYKGYRDEDIELIIALSFVRNELPEHHTINID